MINIVSAEVKKSGNTVLANVHDAVVVRNQIPAKLLVKIERKVQQRTGVTYFALGETGYWFMLLELISSCVVFETGNERAE